MNDRRPIAAVCADLQRLLAGPLRDPDEVSRLAEEVAAHPQGVTAVGTLLRLLEANPEVDWGSPGPVTHAVETFFRRGYEPLLLESVARAPTSHTLWMVNRVANGVDGGLREQFLAAMTAATRAVRTWRTRSAWPPASSWISKARSGDTPKQGRKMSWVIGPRCPAVPRGEKTE